MPASDSLAIDSLTPGRDDDVVVAVLAAGYGTRMRTGRSKHLEPVAGVPIVERVLRAGLAIKPRRTIAVVNPTLADLPRRLAMAGDVETIVQHAPRGTADAVHHALSADPDCSLLVSLLGDSPLLTGETVAKLVDGARSTGAKVTVLSCRLDDAAAYGRVERSQRGDVLGIVEWKNDDPEQRQGCTEINSGIMVLDAAWAREALARLEADAGTGELLLTDLVALAVREGAKPGAPWPVAAVLGDPSVARGVNDLVELATVDALARDQVRQRLMQAGVTIIGPETVFIDEHVEVEAGTTILPFSMLTGRTRVGTGCTIGPHAILHDATIGDRVVVTASTIRSSSVDAGSDVGPYSHLRGGTRVGPDVHVGNYVEMKNADVGQGAKCGHVSYIGDATVGAGTNIGAGTITANFNGREKHRTTLGERVFTGSGTVLIAPVEVGEGARTGAGSVVNRDVPAGATVVGVPARAIKRKQVSETPREEEPNP